jgi:hypothetical protein
LAGIIALVIWACGLSKPAQPDAPLSFNVIFGANLLVGVAVAAAGAVFGFIFTITGLSRARRETQTICPTGLEEIVKRIYAPRRNIARSGWSSLLRKKCPANDLLG